MNNKTDILALVYLLKLPKIAGWKSVSCQLSHKCERINFKYGMYMFYHAQNDFSSGEIFFFFWMLCQLKPLDQWFSNLLKPWNPFISLLLWNFCHWLFRPRGLAWQWWCTTSTIIPNLFVEPMMIYCGTPGLMEPQWCTKGLWLLGANSYICVPGVGGEQSQKLEVLLCSAATASSFAAGWRLTMALCLGAMVPYQPSRPVGTPLRNPVWKPLV